MEGELIGFTEVSVVGVARPQSAGALRNHHGWLPTVLGGTVLGGRSVEERRDANSWGESHVQSAFHISCIHRLQFSEVLWHAHACTMSHPQPSKRFHLCIAECRKPCRVVAYEKNGGNASISYTR